MRFTAVLAGVFVCVVVFLANGQKASAEIYDNPGQLTSKDLLTLLDEASLADKLASKKMKKTPVKKVVKYIVHDGDSLAKIAKYYDVEWERIFNKNENITDPNILNPGITIIIPDSEEELPDRASDMQVEIEDSTPRQTISPGSSAGNSYVYGYCTWYAKNRRPDLPNQMGNAISWVSSARAMGIPTGAEPRVGAIGQSGNHVVYVEKVNKDGTIIISDMNYAGRGIITTRKVPAKSHYYIY